MDQKMDSTAERPTDLTYDDVIESQHKEEPDNMDGEKDIISGHVETVRESKSGRSTSLPQEENSDSTERRPRRGSDKEIWVPAKTPSNKENEQEGQITEVPADEPVKPPRKTHPLKKTKLTNSETEKVTGTMSKGGASNEPVKPPRRKLPQAPKSEGKTHQTPAKAEASSGDVSSDNSGSENLNSEERDIVCKPILTSSPNQAALTLSGDSVDDFDRSRRVLSFQDLSSESGEKKVESFYDYLWSEQGGDSPSSSMLPSGRDDRTYEDVPLGSSNGSMRSGFGTGIYDEVIVNQGKSEE